MVHGGAWRYMLVHVGGIGYESGPVLEQTGVGFTLGLVLVLLGMHVGGFPWIVFGTSIGQERKREEKRGKREVGEPLWESCTYTSICCFVFMFGDHTGGGTGVAGGGGGVAAKEADVVERGGTGGGGDQARTLGGASAA